MPGPIYDLYVEALSPTNLSLSWKAPRADRQNPCRASNYLITYELLNLDQCQEVHRYGGSVNSSRTSVRLHGLEAYSTYRVVVIPVNDAGNGTAISAEGTTLETRK